MEFERLLLDALFGNLSGRKCKSQKLERMTNA